MMQLSLRVKLPIAVVFIIMLLSLPILLYGYIHRTHLVERNSEINKTTILDSAQFSARESLETGIYNYFNEYVESIVQRGDVNAVVLLDDKKQIVSVIPDLPSADGVSAQRSILKSTSHALFDTDLVENTGEEEIVIGTLIIYFNDDQFQAQQITLFYEALAIFIYIVLAAALCIFLVDRNIIRRIRLLVEVLNQYQSGCYKAEIPFSSNDELGELAQTISETGKAFESYEFDLKEERDKAMRDRASLMDQEINHVTVVQGALVDLRANAARSMELAVQVLDDKTSPFINKQIEILSRLVGDIDKIADTTGQNLDRFVNKVRHEAVKTVCVGIKEAVNQVCRRSMFNCDVDVSEELLHSQGMILTDIDAIVRLSVNAIAYWSGNNPSISKWNVSIYLKKLPSEKTKLCVEYSAYVEQTAEDFYHTFIDIDERNPIYQIIKSVCSIYKVKQTINQSTNNRVAVCYEFDVDISSGIQTFESPMRLNLLDSQGLLLIGDDMFLEQVGNQLKIMQVEHLCLMFSQLAELVKYDDRKTLVLLVDYKVDMMNTEDLLELTKNPSLHIVLIADSKANEANIKQHFEVSEILYHPLKASDLHRLSSLVISKNIVPSLLSALTVEGDD